MLLATVCTSFTSWLINFQKLCKLVVKHSHFKLNYINIICYIKNKGNENSDSSLPNYFTKMILFVLLGYICLLYLYNGNTVYHLPTFHMNHLSSLKLAMVAVCIYTMEISKHCKSVPQPHSHSWTRTTILNMPGHHCSHSSPGKSVAGNRNTSFLNGP